MVLFEGLMQEHNWDLLGRLRGYNNYPFTTRNLLGYGKRRKRSAYSSARDKLYSDGYWVDDGEGGTGKEYRVEYNRGFWDALHDLILPRGVEAFYNPSEEAEREFIWRRNEQYIDTAIQGLINLCRVYVLSHSRDYNEFSSNCEALHTKIHHHLWDDIVDPYEGETNKLTTQFVKGTEAEKTAAMEEFIDIQKAAMQTLWNRSFGPTRLRPSSPESALIDFIAWFIVLLAQNPEDVVHMYNRFSKRYHSVITSVDEPRFDIDLADKEKEDEAEGEADRQNRLDYADYGPVTKKRRVVDVVPARFEEEDAVFSDDEGKPDTVSESVTVSESDEPTSGSGLLSSSWESGLWWM